MHSYTHALIYSYTHTLIHSYTHTQRQFEDQVDIQMKLEEIAVELKQRCSDDQGKMQSLLPELLETHGVPTFTFTPVYNPRSAAYMYVA